MSHESITEWCIVITELVLPDEPHSARKILNTIRLKTLAELREYFHLNSKFSIAKSLGYDLKQQPHADTYNERLIGRLAFEYKDRFVQSTLEFLSVTDFVAFLQKHPALASLLGYAPKK